MAETYTGLERRSAHRFPVELGLRYRVGLPSFSGPFQAGKTLDMSRRGILFTINANLSGYVNLTRGRPVEILIEWPVNTEEQRPLNLMMHGRVVRVQKGTVPAIAAEIRRYEFVPSKSK